MVYRLLLTLFFVCQIFTADAQDKRDGENLDMLAQRHSASSLDLFIEMLGIPNDSHHPEMLLKNIVWFEKAFSSRGFSVTRLEAPSVPVLILERKVKNPGKSVLFYIHGDGQPVDPQLWNQEDPYKPVLKELNSEGRWEIISMERLEEGFDPEWRIFGRSSSDDKGPVAMFLAAVDAMDEAGMQPDYDIKVFLDFEEEIGSPHIEKIVSRSRNLLESDMIIVFDGPNHTSKRPTLCFGARGMIGISLTTYGARMALHSGHYGNYSPNPAFVMAELLAEFKDSEGRVIIPGFYDDIQFSPEEKRILENVPDDEDAIRRTLGIAKSEKVGNNYQESLQYPSLNIRGMQSGRVGELVTNAVPSTCVVELDLRTVPESDPQRLIRSVRKYIEDQGFYVTDREPTDEERLKYERIIKFESSVSYNAFRTSVESEPGIFLNSALTRAFGSEPVKLRILGGSLPIAPFINVLDVPAVIVPTVNPDNNQHGPDENIRLGNYRDGIRTILAIFTEKF